MDSFDLSEQRIVQLEQIPSDIRHQVERGDGVEYALDLSLNRLRTIDQIGVFEHVCQLDLSGNQLESINGIQALRRLQSLDLSRNCITSVDLLALVPTLRVLKVAENSLTSIDSLQLLPELRVVDASYNRIAKWPTLAGLSLLETLDLSDNMLDAFPPSISSTLFPSQLRRLSIARNQIDKLCGISSLGMHVPVLEFFAFDGNPVVLQVSRSGGQLERLLATFFFCLPLSNDGGLTMSCRTRDEFSTPPHTLNALKRAIVEGREAEVETFLVTGSVAGQRSPQGEEERGTFPPPPPPVNHPLPTHCQNQLDGPGDDRRILDNALALSRESKMEMWKRIQEDRKTNVSQSSGPSISDNYMYAKTNRAGKDFMVEQSVTIAPMQDDVRGAALTASDLGLPGLSTSSQAMSALDISNFSGTNPLEAATLATSCISTRDLTPQNGADNEALSKRVKLLAEQVATMRKYMKVWIKREKMVREASARKIQRWLRRLQREFRLKQRIILARKRFLMEYGFRHCSSNLIQNDGRKRVTEQPRSETVSAQLIQSHVRGFIVRQRIPPFKKVHIAAFKIQKTWRETMTSQQELLYCDGKFPFRNHTRGRSKVTSNSSSSIRWHTLLHGVLRCSRDVKQLQQVCAVQDEAIRCLWNDQAGIESANNTNTEKKIVQFQRLWHEHSVRRQKSEKSTMHVDRKGEDSSTIHEMQNQLDRQSFEIDQLKQQLQALQNIVAGLTATSIENST